MNRESTPVAQTEYPGGDPGTRHLTDPTFLKELRVQMLKFATIQLRDEALAEDAVQEALIGALKKAASFNRRSALKTCMSCCTGRDYGCANVWKIAGLMKVKDHDELPTSHAPVIGCARA
ncbi:MAG: sigma factor [Exilibacterium sp.]